MESLCFISNVATEAKILSCSTRKENKGEHRVVPTVSPVSYSPAVTATIRHDLPPHWQLPGRRSWHPGPGWG